MSSQRSRPRPEDPPHDPAAPRLDEPAPWAVLEPDQIVDDALVSGVAAERVTLAGHRSEFAELSESVVGGGSMAGSTWYRPSWRDLVLRDTDLANSVVDEGTLTRVEIHRCRLTGAVWSGSTLSDVTVRDSVVDLAALRGTTLTRVRFTGCRLQGADLTMARLTDVLFEDCDLSEVQFHQAVVTARVRLERCVLDATLGLGNLRGAVVAPTDLASFSAALARELGLVLIW